MPICCWCSYVICVCLWGDKAHMLMQGEGGRLSMSVHGGLDLQCAGSMRAYYSWRPALPLICTSTSHVLRVVMYCPYMHVLPLLYFL